jgi:hypothetical protein
MAIADKFAPDYAVDGTVDAYPQPYQVISADGAITIAHGTVYTTKGSACAITIDNPPTNMNGALLSIIATTAHAHTVTYTAGFGGGTTGRDVGTFGGAISDGLVIGAYNGTWWVSSTRNVTFG